MEQPKLSLSTVIPIGLMLFSFFFGAGNLIFPPVLGQQAGDNLL
ncbi:MAG: branched-chain amino acid transport system II carrier protein, partial [Phascolarctobacterium sp.]|nr:branched-chain amino acid transport system II carrier protein [Phascolarctobacterium sp.]